MDEVRRLQYLKAMGIEVWQPISGRLAVQTVDLPLPASDPGSDSASGQGKSQSPASGPLTARHQADDGEPEAMQSFSPPEASAFASSEQSATLDDMAKERKNAKGAAPPADDIAAMDWDTLQQTVAGCVKCDLCKSRTQTVFGSGDRQAEWMLIGEGPGQQEDLQGVPFVGKAGQLLTEMLRAMGLAREEVFITNVVKCRPPNNRDPRPEERDACNPYLQRQIVLVRPKIILALGRIAAQHLLHSDAPIGTLRGKVHYLDDIPLLVLYHPAYLLRSLPEKRKAWEDMQMALRVFREAGR